MRTQIGYMWIYVLYIHNSVYRWRYTNALYSPLLVSVCVYTHHTLCVYIYTHHALCVYIYIYAPCTVCVYIYAPCTVCVYIYAPCTACIYVPCTLCVSAHMSVSYIRKAGGTAREIPSSWLLTIPVHDVPQHFAREKTFSSSMRNTSPFSVCSEACVYILLLG